MHGVWDKTNDITAYITSNGHEYDDGELKTKLRRRFLRFLERET